jgi:hypothetical protein
MSSQPKAIANLVKGPTAPLQRTVGAASTPPLPRTAVLSPPRQQVLINAPDCEAEVVKFNEEKRYKEMLEKQVCWTNEGSSCPPILRVGVNSPSPPRHRLPRDWYPITAPDSLGAAPGATSMSSQPEATAKLLEGHSQQLLAFEEKMQAEMAKQRREMAAMGLAIGTLTQAIADLTTTVGRSADLHVECPICMEEARPPMRLHQCNQGHIICDKCRRKVAPWPPWPGVPGHPKCPSCKKPITSRPVALERQLGLC